jgi:DNA-binding FadR family transcriptional regulator
MTDLAEQRTGLAVTPIRQRYEQIADQLLAEVRTGRLAPGDRLPAERELAQRFGVGRSSVREALGSLGLRGIVETRAGAGSFVARDAAQRAAQLDALPAAGDAGPAAVFEARLMLEPAVARQAARQATGPDPVTRELLATMEASSDPADPAQRRGWSDADRLFHRQIAVRTANPVLVAFADHLAALMDQPLWRALRDESIAVPGRTALQLAEHRLIAAAIDEGDADAAASLTTQHLRRSRRYMALDHP